MNILCDPNGHFTPILVRDQYYITIILNTL